MSGAQAVRRQDTTRGPPLRVLSLDGGGVRGYSIFILLQELMHRTYVEIHGRAPQRHEIPKPCEHFDLIAGTGTGGLIAIMLGRLRMDIDTCKDVYVRMTRRVFETDKTIAGIPYRSTLFKASKLSDAIRDCVREHTIYDDEGNDMLATAADMRTPVSPNTPASAAFSPTSSVRRSISSISRSPTLGSVYRQPMAAGRFGNPDAHLYDVRENRTKTAVTAVYRGSAKNAPAAFLRSYDSRREPAPEYNCTIWEAGRATTAIGLAFKPIQIGQSVFIDEGNGRFNPSPQVLDEATVSEWPGREVGVFVSIGTGKRPVGTDSQKSQWFASFLGGAIGDFAEARSRLIAKIEGCEETHRYMIREHLGQRGVSADNYYRLNVEVGVGEFGMNEWNRLTDISTNTRMYLSKPDVQNINHNASVKLGKIHKAKQRWERAGGGPRPDERESRYSWQESIASQEGGVPLSNTLAAELPADEGFSETRPSSLVQQQQSSSSSPPHTPSAPTVTPPYKPPFPYQRVASGGDKFAVLDQQQQQQQQQGSALRKTDSQDLPIPVESDRRAEPVPLALRPHKRTDSQPSSRQQYAAQQAQQARPVGRHHPGYPADPPSAGNPLAPPVPPKTPLPQGHEGGGHTSAYGGAGAYRPMGGRAPPYPDTDGPPPPVNMARKPEYGVR